MKRQKLLQRRESIGVVSRELFMAYTVLYIVLLLFENFRPGFVSNFVDMDLLVGILLMIGAVMVSTMAARFRD